MLIKNGLQNISIFSYKLFTSIAFMLLQVALGGWFFIENMFVPSIYCFLIIIIIVLLTCKDITPMILPMMILAMSVLKMYGTQIGLFNQFIVLGVLVGVSLIAHFIIFRVKLKFGKLFLPTLFVAIAIIVGGAFKITMKEYFATVVLYYLFGLSIGTVFIYFLLRNYIFNDGIYRPMKTLSRTFLAVSLMGLIMLLSALIPAIKNSQLINIQWSNNLSTYLLLSMPFSFYYASRSKYGVAFFMFGLINYLTIFLTFSRGGILFGSIMVLICVVATLITCSKSNRYVYLGILMIVGISAFVLLLKNKELIEVFKKTMEIEPNEIRAQMFYQAIEYFFKNPIFGVGLGHYGEFYYPASLGMYWYHSTPFQVIASFGLVGVFAYSYQLFARLKILFKNRNKVGVYLFLAFLGFELMALVNPGDFVPLPNMMILNALLIVAEVSIGETISDKDEIFDNYKSEYCMRRFR